MKREKSFRTILEPTPSPEKIQWEDGILSLGSCFSEHIGNEMQLRKLKVRINPFGIVYHPAAGARALERMWDREIVREEELIERDGLWHSWDFHGRFSAVSPDLAVEQMNRSLLEGGQQIRKARWLILTFGTARAFLWKASGRPVANCHRFPGDHFRKKLFAVRETLDRLEPILEKIKAGNPDLRVICTVSPVRHLRDGLIENQESKAILTLVSRELERNHEFIRYFPSYELQLDDLRDYRFYEADGAHPSRQAIDYIWESFMNTYFTEKTRRKLEEIRKINLRLAHRPLHPEAATYRQFLSQTLEEAEALERQFPDVDFSGEKESLKIKLASL
jgi:hypothetical protein